MPGKRTTTEKRATYDKQEKIKIPDKLESLDSPNVVIAEIRKPQLTKS